jgi:predicted GTPase
MKIKDDPQLRRAVQNARTAIRLFRSVGQVDLAKPLETLVETVEAERFVVGVIGATKRGKSTLINGLLGRGNDDCAPIARAPATNVISVFGRQEQPTCRVCFIDREQRETITESEIRLFATEQHNPGNSKKVRSIEVVAPFPGLEENVFLVDTPGAANALERMHGEVLLGFLPNADAVIFLVTAEDPLNESELELLRAVRSADVKKLFFAINMVDRVESGDLEADALAVGIQHNRAALASLGFHASKFYRISAKRYYEERRDPGTEELLADVRASIATERISIVVDRLTERTRTALEASEQGLSVAIEEATADVTVIEAELGSLRIGKRELERGRHGREAEFRRAWAQAFQKLESDLTAIRHQLLNEYSEKIESTPALRASPLLNTIHADVAISFQELFTVKVQECEASIEQARRRLHHDVCGIAINSGAHLQRTAGPISTAKDALEAGLAGLPALITGTVTANLPGFLATMILGSAPTVATAIWWNPLTWAQVALTAGPNLAVTGIGAAVGTTLSVIATPLSILAFGYSGFRVFDSWRAQKIKQKNELAVSVRNQIEDAYKQIRDQVATYRCADIDLLATYQRAIDSEIVSLEDRLAHLLNHRPDDATIQQMRERHRLVASQKSVLLLESEPGKQATAGSPESLTETFISGTFG